MMKDIFAGRAFGFSKRRSSSGVCSEGPEFTQAYRKAEDNVRNPRDMAHKSRTSAKIKYVRITKRQ